VPKLLKRISLYDDRIADCSNLKGFMIFYFHNRSLLSTINVTFAFHRERSSSGYC